MLNKEPNKATTKIQSNFTPEMTYGQVFFCNGIFWLTLAPDGDLLPPRPGVRNNPCQSQLLRHRLLLKLTYSSYKCWRQPWKKGCPNDHPNKPCNTQPVTASTDDQDSSSSSDSDSSSSSEEAILPNEGERSLLVINNKSHVVHAASRTNPSSTRRACFTLKETTFEVNCRSSMIGVPVEAATFIPLEARICQCKACLACYWSHFEWRKLLFCNLSISFSVWERGNC